MNTYYTAVDPIKGRILAFRSRQRLKRAFPYAHSINRVLAYDLDHARVKAFALQEVWLMVKAWFSRRRKPV